MTLRLAVLLVAFAVVGCRDDVTAADLYAEHCASCHGPDGRGDPRRLGFYPQVDLTSSRLVRRGEDGLIYRRIAYGYGAMPGFRHKLAINQMVALADYTLAFNPEPRKEPR